jgi:hypothetical protein
MPANSTAEKISATNRPTTAHERGIVREELGRGMQSAAIYESVKSALLNEEQIIAQCKGGIREMCPHAVGTKQGKPRALFYQFAGFSESGLGPHGSLGNWRCVDIDELSNVSRRTGAWHTAKVGGHSKPSSCLDKTELEWWADVAEPRQQRGGQ